MRRTVLFFAVAMLLAAITVFAQTSTTATLRGKIINDAGSGVANAEINAVNTGSGFVKTVKSGSDGTYTLAGLSPGTYNIRPTACLDPPPRKSLQTATTR